MQHLYKQFTSSGWPSVLHYQLSIAQRERWWALIWDRAPSKGHTQCSPSQDTTRRLCRPCFDACPALSRGWASSPQGLTPTLPCKPDGDCLNPWKAGCSPETTTSLGNPQPPCVGGQDTRWLQVTKPDTPCPCLPPRKTQREAQKKCTAIAFAYFLSLLPHIAASLFYHLTHAVGFPAVFSRDFFFLFWQHSPVVQCLASAWPWNVFWG